MAGKKPSTIHVIHKSDIKNELATGTVLLLLYVVGNQGKLKIKAKST